jgi:hypothetical protein
MQVEVWALTFMWEISVRSREARSVFFMVFTPAK